jgi:hypothetical protein
VKDWIIETVVRRDSLTISVVVFDSGIVVVKEPSSFLVSVVQLVAVSLMVVIDSVVSLNMVIVVVQVFSSNVVEVISVIFSVLVVVTGINREIVAVSVKLSFSISVIVLGGTSFVCTRIDVSLLATRLEISVLVVLAGRLTVVLVVSVQVSPKCSVFVPRTVSTSLAVTVLVKVTT